MAAPLPFDEVCRLCDLARGEVLWAAADDLERGGHQQAARKLRLLAERYATGEPAPTLHATAPARTIVQRVHVHHRGTWEPMAGKTFNSWTVLKDLEGRWVLVQCGCGKIAQRDRQSIRDGRSRSCKSCALTKDMRCEHCGTTDKSKFCRKKTECSGCILRGRKHGHCPSCGFPWGKTIPCHCGHTAGQGGTNGQ